MTESIFFISIEQKNRDDFFSTLKIQEEWTIKPLSLVLNSFHLASEKFPKWNYKQYEKKVSKR